jgi:hypothetical protein
MRLFALTGLFLAGTAAAHQAPETVFGLELNAPVSIPECQLNRGSRTYFPEAGSCYKRDQVRNSRGKLVDAEGPLGDERVEIYFAHRNRPAIVSGYKIWGVLKGGRLLSVGTRTGGISTQSQDLAQLKEKYGEPTRFESQSLQNGAGAKFEGFLAEWKLPTGTFVKLESPDMALAKLPPLGGPNVGTMSVMTAEIKAEREAKREATESQRTKL